METVIKWHETAKGLPEQKIIKMKNHKGEYLLKIDEPCLVIWEGKIKPGRYLTEEKRWEGHTEEQVPAYWIKLKDTIAEG